MSSFSENSRAASRGYQPWTPKLPEFRAVRHELGHPARPSQLEALARLNTMAAHDAYRAVQIRGWIEDSFCHVIEMDGDLHHHFFDSGFLEMLIVGERFRRRRLNLKLVDHFQSICERPKLFTSTNRSNAAMQALLKEAGFRESVHIDNLDVGDPEQVFFRPCAR